MATLADIKVTLTVDTSRFYKQLKAATQALERFAKTTATANLTMSQNVSQNFQAINNATNKSAGTQKDFANTVGMSMRDVNGALGDAGRGFRNLNRMASRYVGLTNEEVGTLPLHLQHIADDLDYVSHNIGGHIHAASTDLDRLRNSIINNQSASNEFSSSLSADGKIVADIMRDVAEQTRIAELAVLGLNENGNVAIDTTEASIRLMEYTEYIRSTREELTGLQLQGLEFGAFSAGMDELNQATLRVQDSMRSARDGGDRYINTLARLGIYTEGYTDRGLLAMERYRDSFMMAHDRMMAKSTQAQDIISHIDKLKFHGLSQQLLKIGDSLEERAKQGNAFHLALKRLGDDAPMSSILKEVNFINKGLGRMTSLTMGMAWANLGMLVGLVMLSNHVDGRLIPAFEELKGTWTDALTPFIKAFTTFGVAVLNGANALGEVFKRFAELHPQLSQMFWGFLALTIALTLLLAPLAVGIGLTGGLAAGFSLLWATIAPFVLGFLTVAGVAMLVAAAIVTVVAVIHNMWKASENFRNAITNGWNTIKQTILNALAPVMAKWEELKVAFFGLISTMTGGQAKSMGEFWKWLGDKMAVFINWFVATLVPAIKVGAGFVANAISIIIDVAKFLLKVFQLVWPQISALVSYYIGLVKNIIQQSVNIIVNLAELFKNLFSGKWKAAFENVKNIVSSALSLIWSYIQLTVVGKILKLFGGFVGSIAKSLAKLPKALAAPFITAYGEISNWVGKIKNAVMNMFSGKIKTPRISMSGSLNPKDWVSKGLPKLHVNWNATGNIFNGASILGGNQGVGEAGAEVVMPIQHKRYMSGYAKMVASMLPKFTDDTKSGDSTYNINFNEPVVIREDADVQRIVDELERRRIMEERSKGIFAY